MIKEDVFGCKKYLSWEFPGINKILLAHGFSWWMDFMLNVTCPGSVGNFILVGHIANLSRILLQLVTQLG